MEFDTDTARVYIMAAIAVLLLAAVTWYSWREIRKARHQRHIHRVISRLGLERLRNVALPDGVDGVVFIDYLLLVPNGAVVIDIMHLEGYLFGGSNITQWSQVVKHRTFKFDNPIYSNEAKCQAVQWNVENARQQHPAAAAHRHSTWQTQGWIVFSNAGSFPKGIPRQVCMIDQLAEQLAPLGSGEISAADRAFWDYLHNLSINTTAQLSR